MTRIAPEWLWLTVAGLSEMAWTITLKYTDGFTRLGWSLATLGVMAVSFYCMSRALQTLPIGTVYAVWTGIGAAGAALWGVAVEGDPATPLRNLLPGTDSGRRRRAEAHPRRKLRRHGFGH